MTGLSLVAPPVSEVILSSWLNRAAVLHGVRWHHLLEWSGCSGLERQWLMTSLPKQTSLLFLEWFDQPRSTFGDARTVGWAACSMV
jgi:hypothetical protein